MTYRSDSDVWYPYGYIFKREIPAQIDFLRIAKTKTKMAAWFVSNCRTFSRREKYVEKLKKTIPVDVYGACGDKKCGCGNNIISCNWKLSRDYKFYLSFENSFCNDFVSKKAYYYMEADVVPVVRGGANYTKFLPPHSFINTADFKSPKHLGEYLLYLDNNHTAYVEYFKWKTYYYSKRTRTGVCDLCRKLTHATKHAIIYENVYSWWHKGQCFNPMDLG